VRAERAIRLARLIDAVPFAADRPSRVLDVGGGYGAVSREVLHAFPRARVTLHDYSRVMFDAGAHLRLFEQAGYARSSACLHYESPTAIVRATA
jgi:ubiquinone/menaquinone biosynthesis C-methylase UbiE